MGDKTLGEQVDMVVDKVSEELKKTKEKLAVAKEEVADAAHDLSKIAKKAVDESGEVISEHVHKRK